MQKIGIFTDATSALLTIETPSELQFELHDATGKLLIIGNKLAQPSISINIKNLPKGTYTLTLHIDGQKVQKTVEL